MRLPLELLPTLVADMVAAVGLHNTTRLRLEFGPQNTSGFAAKARDVSRKIPSSFIPSDLRTSPPTNICLLLESLIDRESFSSNNYELAAHHDGSIYPWTDAMVGELKLGAFVLAASVKNPLVFQRMVHFFHGKPCPNEITPRYFSSPLTAASRCGNLDVVKLLLQRGADAHDFGYGMISPINVATFAGHVKIIRQLILFGSVVVAETYINCVESAIEGGKRLDAVEELLKHRHIYSKLRLKDFVEKYVFFVAARTGNVPVLKMALKLSIDVNRSESGPFPPLNALTIAAQNGRTEVIRHLLDYGLDTTHPNFHRSLVVAIWHRRTETAMFLIEHGADVNAHMIVDTNGTCKSALAAAASQENRALIGVLIRRGARLKAHGHETAQAEELCKKSHEKEVIGVTKKHELDKAEILLHFAPEQEKNVSTPGTLEEGMKQLTISP
ncbi:ankyrin [Mollisia scopiformis]|uniref:Ankyrin n=1 Tax=Mollisia scopiformis TaxID=149040 RepID=A0A194XAA9_MOLSC|nr:ankyrin [Mollisia scopiformis]KUJ17101.1 ankyrin [Mollisia scopiformis]